MINKIRFFFCFIRDKTLPSGVPNGRSPVAIRSVLFALGGIFMVAASAWAQHCPFDGTAILVVDVRDAETREPIKGLRLTIVDEDGRQVLQKSQTHIGSEFTEVPLVFIRNPARTDPDWRPYEFEKIRYSFAGDNYILPLARYRGEAARLIKVEDIDGEANGRYLCGIHVVKADDYFDLHDNVGWPNIRNNPETLPPREKFHHTILVLLEKARSSFAGSGQGPRTRAVPSKPMRQSLRAGDK
jgi:hypothetical protein